MDHRCGRRPPYRGASHSDIIRQVLISEPPRLRELRPNVPARLEAIAQRALARNPDDRYTSALELRADLQEIVNAGRRLGPADVARCVELLLTGPSFMTGQIVAVDGGRSLA